jgi:hypothetical protein
MMRGINIHGSEGEESVGTWLSGTSVTSVVGQGQTINERNYTLTTSGIVTIECTK